MDSASAGPPDFSSANALLGGDNNPPKSIPKILFTNERVTAIAGKEMIDRSGIDFTHHEGLHILDNACGAGIITALIKHAAGASPVHVTASDKDASMVDLVRKRAEECGWQNVEVMQLDQAAIPPALDRRFSHVLTNFGIFFSRNDEEVVANIYRALKPGGVASFTSWKLIAWWGVVQAAIKTYIPGAPPLEDVEKSFRDPGWSSESYAIQAMSKAGFTNVTSELYEYKLDEKLDPKDFAAAMVTLTRGYASMVWSKEDFDKYAPYIEAAAMRHLKEEYLHGQWDGKMRAIVTVGRKPDEN